LAKRDDALDDPEHRRCANRVRWHRLNPARALELNLREHGGPLDDMS
jgi:hypothetical protein